MPKPQKLRVTFVIDAPLVGDFLHHYADKVQGLDIAALVSVPYNKNKTGKQSAEPKPTLQRTQDRERTKQARVDVLACFSLDNTPLARSAILEKLPEYDRKWLASLTYRMLGERQLVKTKNGLLAMPPPAKNKNGSGSAHPSH